MLASMTLTSFLLLLHSIFAKRWDEKVVRWKRDTQTEEGVTNSSFLSYPLASMVTPKLPFQGIWSYPHSSACKEPDFTFCINRTYDETVSEVNRQADDIVGLEPIVFIKCVLFGEPGRI